MKASWPLEPASSSQENHCIVSAALFEDRSPVLSLEVHEYSQLANFAPASFLAAVLLRQ